MTLEQRFRHMYNKGNLEIPFPGSGCTAVRHRKLREWACADLSLARLAEAHVDATAILHEAGLVPQEGLYGVWAAETPGCTVRMEQMGLSGTKMFCSGAGIIDYALVTVEGCLVEADLRTGPESFEVDETNWKVAAFADTQTATVRFFNTPVARIIGEDNWYLNRTGFWHGACGPAACWAGGAAGLVNYALQHARNDPHMLAHLGAMSADTWAMEAYLDTAGNQIDECPGSYEKAQVRALTLRHLIEQAASDILCRTGRAFGPRPLAFDSAISKRYQEVELYIRQSHAERDLESLGRQLLASGER
jgi:hypothetical protein